MHRMFHRVSPNIYFLLVTGSSQNASPSITASIRWIRPPSSSPVRRSSSTAWDATSSITPSRVTTPASLHMARQVSALVDFQPGKGVGGGEETLCFTLLVPAE